MAHKQEIIMTFEIEIKAYCDNTLEVIELLQEKGAEKLDSIYQKDIYFNHPFRDFVQTDEAFRIRTVNNSSFITYKGPKLNTESKTRSEFETSVGDFDTVYQIVTHLGLFESGIVEKKREEYNLNGITVCVDSVVDLGNFVEFEKIGNNIKEIESELFSMAEEFNLNRFEKKSYLQLKMEKSSL
jgi:adenylate cyclase class 2